MSIATFFKLLGIIFWIVAGIIRFYVMSKVSAKYNKEYMDNYETMSEEAKLRNYDDCNLVMDTLESVMQYAFAIGILIFGIGQAIDYANADF